jgi:hypothetical protein
MPVDRGKAIELYRSGFSLREVGDELGVTHSYIRKILRQAGEELRKRGRPKRGIVVGHAYARITDEHGRMVLLHRSVAEAVKGSPLTEDEVVHHIDGDRTSNTPDNLYIFPDRRSHNKYHAYIDRWALRQVGRPGGPMGPKAWMAS